MITISKKQIAAVLKSLGSLPKGEKLELNSLSGLGLLKLYSQNTKSSLEFQAGEGNLEKCFVDFKQFSQAIKTCQGDTISWEKKGETVTVSEEFGFTELDCVHEPWSTEKKEPKIRMKAEVGFGSLFSALNVLKSAITKEKGRYGLDNFHISSRKKLVTIAATNGRLLMAQELQVGVICAIAGPGTSGWEFEAALPFWIAKLLPTLPKSLSRVWIDVEDDCTMLYGKDFIAHWAGEVTWPDWRKVITSTCTSAPESITFKDVKSLQSLKNFQEVEISLEKEGENLVVESGTTTYRIPASAFSASFPFRFKVNTSYLLPTFPKKGQVLLELYGKRKRVEGDGKERTERILIRREGFQSLINCIA